MLPVVLLLALLVCSLTNFMVEATETLVKYKLNTVSNVVDSNIDILNSIAMDLSDNEILLKEPAEKNIYAHMQIKNEIKKNIGKNDFCSDIIFYFWGGEHIYTQDTVDTKDNFFNERYGLSNKQEADALFGNMLSPELVFLGSDSEYSGQDSLEILYVVPLLNRQAEATAIFVLRNKWFSKQLEDFFGMCGGEVIIECGKNNKTIVFGESTAEYGGNNVESITVLSNNVGLKLTGLCNKQKVFSSIRRIYYVVFFYTVGLLIIGLILVHKLTALSYKPVLDIGRMVETDFNASDDEFELIRSAITKMKVENEQLQDVLKNREDKLQRLMLKDILDLKDNENDSYKSLFDDFDENGFSMKQMVVFVVCETDCEISKDIFKEQRDIFVYELKTEYKNTWIFLVRCNEDVISGIKAIFEDVVVRVKREQDISLNIIEGKIVDSIFEIKDSFASAYNIYEHRNANNAIISNEGDFWYDYPVDLLTQFENRLERKRFEEAKATLAELKIYLSDVSSQLFKKRCIIIEIFNIFIRNIHSVENESQKIALLQYLIQDSETLDMNNVDEIFDNFVKYVKMLTGKKKKNSDLVQGCCQYINEHFFEYTLTVQHVTELFNISATFLNQKMKEELDMNVYEYITFIRMENAIHMLLNTDLPVKKILSFVGYYDVSSFGRKFKSIYGVSPAEYRKKHKKSS